MTKSEETRVIQAIRSGDIGRFEDLVHAYEKGIYTLCLRMLRDEQDALDAAQESFFRAYRALDRFRGESRFSTWLYQIASHICLDMLRSRSGADDISLTGEDDTEFDLPDLRPSPQTVLEQKELRKLVLKTLEELSPDSRQIVVLRDINGLSYEEIEAITGLEPGTVKSRIYRARRRLADLLLKNRNFSGYAPSNQRRTKGGADT